MINYSFTFEDLEFFLLVFIRIASFVFVAPFFSTSNTPRRVKAGFSIMLAYIVSHTMVNHSVPAYSTMLGYSTIVLKEAATGLLIGYGASICMTIVQFAGKISDMDIGLSMVQLLDPVTKQNSGFVGNIYQYMLVLIMLITNMHYFFIKAIVETFEIVPIGMANFGSDKILSVIIRFMVDYMNISFRICLPIVAAMLLLNAVLGIMAKVAPQMYMFSVGMQIKVLVGLCILFFTIGMLPSVSNLIYSEMKTMMATFVSTML